MGWGGFGWVVRCVWLGVWAVTWVPIWLLFNVVMACAHVAPWAVPTPATHGKPLVRRVVVRTCFVTVKAGVAKREELVEVHYMRSEQAVKCLIAAGLPPVEALVVCCSNVS